MEYVYCNIRQLDDATGGIPKGRITVICGDDDSGKPTLALHIASQIRKPILFIDADNGIGPPHLRGIKELYRVCPETLEDSLLICQRAADGFGAIVIDTIAALPTRNEIDSCLGQFYCGRTAASILSSALPTLVSTMKKTGCTLIIVTQMRNIPGATDAFRNQPIGGHALRFYTAMRLHVHQIRRTKNGMYLLINVEKNKYRNPFGRAEIGLLYGQGLVTKRSLEVANADR